MPEYKLTAFMKSFPPMPFRGGRSRESEQDTNTIMLLDALDNIARVNGGIPFNPASKSIPSLNLDDILEGMNDPMVHQFESGNHLGQASSLHLVGPTLILNAVYADLGVATTHLASQFDLEDPFVEQAYDRWYVPLGKRRDYVIDVLEGKSAEMLDVLARRHIF